MPRRAFLAPSGRPRFVPSRARQLLDHTDDYRHDGNYGGNPCITIGNPCKTVGLVGVLISLEGVFIGPSGKHKRLVLPRVLPILRVSLPFFGLLRQPAHNNRALPHAISIKNKARLNFFFA
jgi:hypothetical protein